MRVEDVYNRLKRIPNSRVWPEIDELFPNRSDMVRLDWMLPTYSMRAVGTTNLDPLPLISALACLQISIILVDDILDDDPRGKHKDMGIGRAANLALALQAVAQLLSQDLSLQDERINSINTSMQRMAYLTAVGQELDVQEITDETSYWELVQAKSTPFYASALEIGALAGGASVNVCSNMYHIGCILGEMIQVMDDLTDAFEIPAKPDWVRQNNNLIILYAKTAFYPEQLEFITCLQRIDDLSALKSAQSILVSSGAVSYGVYHILERYKQARDLINRTNLHDSSIILELFNQQIRPVIRLLVKIGADIPSDMPSIL